MSKGGEQLGFALELVFVPYHVKNQFLFRGISSWKLGGKYFGLLGK
jgi:hypothetical protein